MNRLEAALLDVVGHLDAHRIPHMVIGGFANLHWGLPRLTEDLDIKALVEEDQWSEFVRAVSERFEILVGDPLQFLRETRVLPIRTPAGVRADLVIAELPYEREAIRRAVPVPVGNRSVRLTTAEDLILHKIISDRPRDRDDVAGVFRLRANALDRAYLDPRVAELAAALEEPEIMDFYRSCWRESGTDG